jgi:hypothetical protein
MEVGSLGMESRRGEALEWLVPGTMPDDCEWPLSKRQLLTERCLKQTFPPR